MLRTRTAHESLDLQGLVITVIPTLILTIARDGHRLDARSES